MGLNKVSDVCLLRDVINKLKQLVGFHTFVWEQVVSVYFKVVRRIMNLFRSVTKV